MTTGGDDIDRAYFADGTPDLSEHSPAYGVETIAQALLNIYREEVDVDSGIEPNLYQETRRIFSEAVADGFSKASEQDIPMPDDAFRDAFLHSADVFSAFRVHQMQQDIAAQMIDSNGNVKPFRKFVKDVSPYIEHRNREWLQTEYNTAILRAQNAAEWQQFMAEKDVFPNLEWIPSTSPNPGEDHRVFWGTVRPVDDPFWNVHKPGDRWNCKCELRQSEKDVTPVPTSRARAIDNAAKGLESNPAKDKEVFSDKHPYYPKNCSVCPFAGNKLMALVHDLAGGKGCHNCKFINHCIYGSDKSHVSEIKKEARKTLQGTTISHKKLEGTISISRRSIDEWTNQPHIHYAEKNRMILYIDRVLKKSTYLGWKKDKSEKPGSKFVHLFETSIQGDKSWIIVKEYIDGNKILYSISDSDNILKGLNEK